MTSEAEFALKVVGDIKGEFMIPAYQRGYRWRDEVTTLLNDIQENGANPYCLQPIVVKCTREGSADGSDPGSFELIDGQQRLTTLYLIFSYLESKVSDAKPTFQLTYETRGRSQGYLAEPGRPLNLDGPDDDIEVFHLDQAHHLIVQWFEHKDRPRGTANKLFDHLCERVKVIWYQVGDVEANELFRRLNVGRIPLTNSELVKALILKKAPPLAGQGPGVDYAAQLERQRQFQSATQWDAIERDLREPLFWAFLTPEPGSAYPSRIELLFDLLSGKQASERARSERFHTFLHFKKRIDDAALAGASTADSANAAWDPVRRLHALLRDWYDSHDLYHRVGYLVATGESLLALTVEAEGCSKSAFGAKLLARIVRRLDLTRESAAELSYKDHKDLCNRVLLLFNVETARLPGSGERYPFAIHHEESWSLEHIHAQNSIPLTKKPQWTRWLADHARALRNLPPEVSGDARLASLLTEMDAAAADPTEAEYLRLQQEVLPRFTLGSGEVHHISNLALLSGGANSAFSNSVFEVKRTTMLELTGGGAYIPICTRRVFVKHYTRTSGQHLHFWSPDDRKAYFDAMFHPVSGLISPFLLPGATAS